MILVSTFPKYVASILKELTYLLFGLKDTNDEPSMFLISILLNYYVPSVTLLMKPQ